MFALQVTDQAHHRVSRMLDHDALAPSLEHGAKDEAEHASAHQDGSDRRCSRVVLLEGAVHAEQAKDQDER
jgi:hypothetical protein